MHKQFTQEEIDNAKERAYATLNYYEVVESYKYKNMDQRFEFMLKIKAEFCKELGVENKIDRSGYYVKMKRQDLK